MKLILILFFAIPLQALGEDAAPDVQRSTDRAAASGTAACARALGNMENGAASFTIVDWTGQPLRLEMMQLDGGVILIQSRTGMRKGKPYVACFSKSLPCPATQDDPAGQCGKRITRPESGWNADRFVIPIGSRIGGHSRRRRPELVSIPLAKVPYILLPSGITK